GDWRRRGSSRAAPLSRGVRARGYRGGSWTCSGNSEGLSGDHSKQGSQRTTTKFEQPQTTVLILRSRAKRGVSKDGHKRHPGLMVRDGACAPPHHEGTAQLISRTSRGGRKLSSKISTAVGRFWNL